MMSSKSPRPGTGDAAAVPRRPGLAALVLRLGAATPLRLLPRRFRDTYAAEMLELFELQAREVWRERGSLVAARFVATNIIDVLVTAFAEHRDSSFDPPAPRAPQPAHTPPGDPFMSMFLQDLKFSLRAFRRQPAFIAVIVLTLALGIGANTAIFSVVNSVLLQPLPYEDSEQIVRVWGRFDPISGFDYPRFPLSPPEFIDYRAQSQALDDVAAFSGSAATLTGPDAEPERVNTAPVSYNLFSLLRTEAHLGRTFTEEEDFVDDQVAVLEYGFWQTRFGGDEGVIGDTITLNDRPWTVIGVMPEGFNFVSTAKIWVPFGINPAEPGNRRAHFVSAIGRLSADSTLEQANAEMATLMDGWREEYPDIHTGHYLFLNPLLDDVVGSARPALMLLMVASGLVLLIVCANVASVLLARGEDRTREIAIRSAMGAGRAQIIRLLMAESLVLGITGGLIGIGVAVAGLGALVASAGPSLPRASSISVDPLVLAVGAAITLATCVMFGLFPALQSARADVQSNLKEGTGSTSASRSRLYFRRGLVVAEVAMCFVLVVSAGLVLRSFDQMLSVDGGFDADNTVVARVALPSARYGDAAAVQQFYNSLTERLESLPGVVSASAGSSLPLEASPGVWDFRAENVPEPGPGEPAMNAAFTTVRADYFETLRTRLVRGRTFTASDDAESELVAVVSEAFVAKFYPNDDPIGRRIMICCPNEDQEAPWMRIVGVVEDVRYRGLDLEPRPAYYSPHAQVFESSYGSLFGGMYVMARTEGDPRALTASLRDAVHEVDAGLPVIALQTMDDVVATSVSQPRFTTRLLGLFALVALALGATGIYGVLAYMVAQRGREIGIRKALGAEQSALARSVVGQGMSLAIAGLVAGAALALYVTQLLQGLLYGVSPTDPLTYALVAGVLGVVALLACGIPTLRAVRVDPLVTLRSE